MPTNDPLEFAPYGAPRRRVHARGRLRETRRGEPLVVAEDGDEATMKNAPEITPNYAPVYAAALYPELAKLFQAHG